MKPCDEFKCKEYGVTCISCKDGAACNPNCAKCEKYNNTCNGSMKYWSHYIK